MPKINANLVFNYAGFDKSRWNQLIGCKLMHIKYGCGSIKGVRETRDGIIVYMSCLRAPNAYCNAMNLAFNVKWIDIPMEISQQINKPGNYPSKPNNSPENIDDNGSEIVEKINPKFLVGDEVCRKSDQFVAGRITKVRITDGGKVYYDVFFSTHQSPTIREEDLVLHNPNTCWGTLDDFLRNLACIKLQRPQSDALYGLYSSRTKFEVYQFKPAVKFLANQDQRLLIADEVGLGKTIEAGIIYLELQARLDLDQVLIVCPSSLKQKWQDELKSRFDEEFEIMDTKRVENFFQEYSRVGESLRLRGIVPLETVRMKRLAEEFANIKLDLVVIDEAHHCRNTSTLANAVASVLVEKADAALLLTATPLQMGQADFFNLLNILSPDEFDNFDAFRHRLEPNQYINKAASILATGDTKNALRILRQVENTVESTRFLSNPYYQMVIKLLKKDNLLKEELVSAQRRLIELNTLATKFTRTRKRDIQEKAPLRTAQTLKVNFTPDEARIYEMVLEKARSEFISSHGNEQGSGWITIMKERQVASCISAYLRRRHKEQMDDCVVEAIPEDQVLENEFQVTNNDDNIDWDFDPTEPTGITSTAQLFKTKATTIIPKKPIIEHDSKFEVFVNALNKILLDDTQTKVIVFSYFRDTIDYLVEKLRDLRIDASTIHGGISIMDRHKIIEAFRDNETIRVLVSSEVGSEGLDFQFCDTIINYDLPWNPMKVEQRIGRIDRFGQTSPRIRIYNLVIEDTIESRILMRLYDRIEIFKHAIGDIEEILGEQIRELRQAVFSRSLTPQEEEYQAEETAKIILRKKQELEEFEDKKLQFLGQEAIFSTIIENTIDSGRFVSDVELQALVNLFIKEKFSLSPINQNENDSTFTFNVNDDFLDYIKTFIFHKMKRDITAHQFLKRIRPGSEIHLTFSSDLAFERKLLEFITPRHPIAKAALDYWIKASKEINHIYNLSIKTDNIDPGEYLFFIYSIEASGIDRESRLIPVVISNTFQEVHSDLSKQFLRLIQTSTLPTVKSGRQCDEEFLKPFEDKAFSFMTKQRDALYSELHESNQARISGRLSGLEQSYYAKRRVVEKRARSAIEPRIQRMLIAQLSNMKARYEAKVNEVNENKNLEVIFSLLLKGVVTIN